MERAERLWPDGPRYRYDEQCFPPSTDSFLLAASPACAGARKSAIWAPGRVCWGFCCWHENPHCR